MEDLSRRNILVATAAGLAAAAGQARAQSFGNPDVPPQGAINGLKNPANISDPGPNNPALSSQFPGAFLPPATDVGELPLFWATFNNAPRRIQDGGWARQVTQYDFQISEQIAGVNMRLTRGGIRELHWHLAAEWAYVTYGVCRVTTIDLQGRANVEDVAEGGLWYFPAGMPHSLQGVGPDGCEFIICFDDGKASEFNTLLLSEWMAHTPPDVLAMNFGVPAETFAKIPLHELYIFQGEVPGPIEASRAEAQGSLGEPQLASTFRLADLPPVKKTRGGEVRIADSTNFTVAKNIAASHVTLHPGGMREMHWHPNADEWTYVIAGQGELTVFNTGPNVVTQNFNPGDVGYIKRAYGHYIRNTGSTDLVYLEVFRSDRVEDISLSEWLTHTPRTMVVQSLNVSPEVIAKFPSDKPTVLPV
ncbi:MAG TPA: cupin domain-containing protein [Hyphomicrobium sp.]|jgi:oxalate decarboxylase|nr:cupin domain-containing protein [Hyphomicrobium sp.]